MVVIKIKREALSVSRFINEILVNQLSIPFKQIVNDTTFNHGAPTGDIFFRGQPFMFTHLQELKVKTHDFNGQLKRLIGEAVRQENNLIKQLQKLA